jgi:hypothetical protein
MMMAAEYLNGSWSWGGQKEWKKSVVVQMTSMAM